jgi:hypothetical protein
MRRQEVTVTVRSSIPSHLAPLLEGMTFDAVRSLAFDAAAADHPPAGFTPAHTGRGGPGVWRVQPDASAPSRLPVLVQTSTDPTNYRFPLCLADAVVARDVAVAVRLNPVAGGVDRAGGIVVRATDPDRYYVARANALEDNVRLYCVVAGKREQIAGRDLKVASATWHALGLVASGARFAVFFNGQRLFDHDDATLAAPGRIGLWTKADSVTCFDDLAVATLV